MKKTLLTLTCALGLFGTSCLGPNNLFNSIQSWTSRSTGSKWGNEGVNLVFWFLPVNSICLLGDIVIFNSIEWWGGENPISPPQPITKVGEEGNN